MLAGEYDCDNMVYQATPDEINVLWTMIGGKDKVAAFWSGDLNGMYLPDLKHFDHEYRHAFCNNHYTLHNQNHSYCLNPHFKIQR
jgi:hypothetical protein